MTVAKHDPQKLRAKARAWPSWKAGGLDGWSIDEIQAMPDQWWDRLAQWLDRGRTGEELLEILKRQLQETNDGRDVVVLKPDCVPGLTQSRM